MYDSLGDYRNNNANIHLKVVMVCSIFTNFHAFFIEELSPCQPTFHARARFCQTMQTLFQSRFLLDMKPSAIQPPNDLIANNRLTHRARNQLACKLPTSRAGKESLQALKEGQQQLGTSCSWPYELASPGSAQAVWEEVEPHTLLICPSPAVLVPGCTDPAPLEAPLQVPLRFQETSALQNNNNKCHNAKWYRNRELMERGREMPPLIQNEPFSFQKNVVNELSLHL